MSFDLESLLSTNQVDDALAFATQASVMDSSSALDKAYVRIIQNYKDHLHDIERTAAAFNDSTTLSRCFLTILYPKWSPTYGIRFPTGSMRHQLFYMYQSIGADQFLKLHLFFLTDFHGEWIVTATKTLPSHIISVFEGWVLIPDIWTLARSFGQTLFICSIFLFVRRFFVFLFLHACVDDDV